MSRRNMDYDADRKHSSRRHEASIRLTQEDIDAFKRAWKEDFNEDIDDDFARHKATQLLRLYALIARDIAPLPIVGPVFELRPSPPLFSPSPTGRKSISKPITLAPGGRTSGAHANYVSTRT